MSNKNQTSVDFLVEKLIELGYLHSKEYGQSPLVSKYIKEAKAIEKEQIENSFNEGKTINDKINTIKEVWLMTSETLEERDIAINKIPKHGEQYYKETFES